MIGKLSFSAVAIATLVAIFATPDARAADDPPPGTQPMGTTGWTGGRRESSAAICKQNCDQPEMATGLDLKGPPVQFHANQTPE
jgi:hypothetical protein